MSRIFLLTLIIFIIQITVVRSQQYSVDPIPPTPTRPANPTEQPFSLSYVIVNVGYKDERGITGFSLNNLTTKSGDVMQFRWTGDGTYSVVESTLENPCKKKEGGFDFGAHTAPYNNSMTIQEVKAFTFFSDVGEDCAKGMYGGANLPPNYVWPTNLEPPPKQIEQVRLNPDPTPTGSMSIAGAKSTQGAQEGSKESLSNSASTHSGFGITIGSLMLISLYFNIVI